jgi:hypothetical protein
MSKTTLILFSSEWKEKENRTRLQEKGDRQTVVARSLSLRRGSSDHNQSVSIKLDRTATMASSVIHTLLCPAFFTMPVYVLALRARMSRLWPSILGTILEELHRNPQKQQASWWPSLSCTALLQVLREEGPSPQILRKLQTNEESHCG